MTSTATVLTNNFSPQNAGLIPCEKLTLLLSIQLIDPCDVHGITHRITHHYHKSSYKYKASHVARSPCNSEVTASELLGNPQKQCFSEYSNIAFWKYKSSRNIYSRHAKISNQIQLIDPCDDQEITHRITHHYHSIQQF